LFRPFSEKIEPYNAARRYFTNCARTVGWKFDYCMLGLQRKNTIISAPADYFSTRKDVTSFKKVWKNREKISFLERFSSK